MRGGGPGHDLPGAAITTRRPWRRTQHLNIPHFQNPGANASNMSLNPDGSIRSLGDFMVITSAIPDQRQFRFGMRLSF
jgi:hypothetical protein